MSASRTIVIGAMCLLGGLETLAQPARPVPDPPPLSASLVPADVSTTSAGVAVAAAADRRFAALDPRGPTPALEVWTDAAGVLVVPDGTAFDRQAWTDDRGRAGVVLVPRTPRVVLTPPIDAARPPARVRGTTGPAWRPVAQACFSRSSDVWSWLDHCYQLDGATGADGADYWELLRYGTAGANVPWTLHGASIGSYPTAASAPQAWVQWSPLGDQTGPCTAITVQITSPFAGISWPVNRCDTWTISKGLAGGTFTVTWTGPATRGERGVAYVMAVRVPHGAFAQWALPGGSNGSPF